MFTVVKVYYHKCNNIQFNGLAPVYLTNKFIRRSDIHQRNTRQRLDLNISKCCSVGGQRSFAYRGCNISNTSDVNLKSQTNFARFKRELKLVLLESYFK